MREPNQKSASPTVKVTRITQSPISAVRWCLDLSCGHEMWITHKGRPKMRVVVCSEHVDKPKE